MTALLQVAAARPASFAGCRLPGIPVYDDVLMTIPYEEPPEPCVVGVAKHAVEGKPGLVASKSHVLLGYDLKAHGVDVR